MGRVPYLRKPPSQPIPSESRPVLARSSLLKSRTVATIRRISASKPLYRPSANCNHKRYEREKVGIVEVRKNPRVVV